MHTFKYRAPKPGKTKSQWFKIIALRIIFPPILLWDLLSILVNSLIGGHIAVSCFDFKAIENDLDFLQARTGFAPLSESPEDMREAILATKKEKFGYDWSSYNFDVTISDSDKLCKTTASTQSNLKKHLIFLRLFDGTTNFVLSDAAQLADGSYVDLPPVNVIKFSHISAQVTRDSLVDNIVENIDNLLKNKVEPENICLGKTNHRLANAIINLVQKRFSEKNILINVVNINAHDEDILTLEENFRFESHRVITYDQSELETFEIQPSSQRNLPITEQKYLISFPHAGNEGQIDNGKKLDLMVKSAHRFQCNVVKFNFRGNGSSTGQVASIEDCIIDGIAQVQRVLDKGVPPEKILIEGHCFGGAVGAAVAKYFHDHEKKIGLFNDRSFSNVTNMLLGKMRSKYALESKNGYAETLLGKCKLFLAMPFLKLVLLLSKWEIEAAKAYESLPDDCKEYMVVKSPKKMRQSVKPIDDGMITNYASLHEAVKYSKPLFTSLNQAEKLKSKARKMHLSSDSAQSAGHVVSKKLLHNETQTADEFYAGFVNRYFSKLG